ncbi:MAG: hypothetical protein HY006_03670 [Candidatus Sungbacteria bacterium]|nr:hypothetical protein [Candidatus Sungbacteria bacterium]
MKSRVPILSGAACALFAIATYCYIERFAPPTGTTAHITAPQSVLQRIDRALEGYEPKELSLADYDAILARRYINDTPFAKAMVLDWKRTLVARDERL